jgi:hypothetical protein
MFSPNAFKPDAAKDADARTDAFLARLPIRQRGELKTLQKLVIAAKA